MPTTNMRVIGQRTPTVRRLEAGRPLLPVDFAGLWQRANHHQPQAVKHAMLLALERLVIGRVAVVEAGDSAGAANGELHQIVGVGTKMSGLVHHANFDKGEILAVGLAICFRSAVSTSLAGLPAV